MLKPPMPGMTDTLEFVKNLWGGMHIPGAMPGMAGVPGIPPIPGAGMSVEDLDKKIADLKAVEAWLTLNQSMLHGSIQALEIQRGTLATLKATAWRRPWARPAPANRRWRRSRNSLPRWRRRPRPQRRLPRRPRRRHHHRRPSRRRQALMPQAPPCRLPSHGGICCRTSSAMPWPALCRRKVRPAPTRHRLPQPAARRRRHRVNLPAPRRRAREVAAATRRRPNAMRAARPTRHNPRRSLTGPVAPVHKPC
jgi:hypothetical protein